MDSARNTLKMWIIAGGTVLVLSVLLVFLQAIAKGDIDYDRSDTALSCVHADSANCQVAES